MWKTVLLIENDHHELNLMRHAIGEVDSTLRCMSFVYADEVVPALTNEMKHFPDYIFLDVDMPRKNVTDLLAELCPMKAVHQCKIAVFAPVMPKRVAYAYRVMGANYAFQKPATREGYREIFSRILGKETYVTLSTPDQ
jgi:two-component SAPR family response regulator